MSLDIIKGLTPEQMSELEPAQKAVALKALNEQIAEVAALADDTHNDALAQVKAALAPKPEPEPEPRIITVNPELESDDCS